MTRCGPRFDVSKLVTSRVDVYGAVPMYGAMEAVRSEELKAVRLISSLNVPTTLTVAVNVADSL